MLSLLPIAVTGQSNYIATTNAAYQTTIIHNG